MKLKNEENMKINRVEKLTNFRNVNRQYSAPEIIIYCKKIVINERFLSNWIFIIIDVKKRLMI